MATYHVRYRYTNKTAESKLPASGRGDHEITLAQEIPQQELFLAAQSHIVAGMEAQGWIDNDVTIIDVVAV